VPSPDPKARHHSARIGALSRSRKPDDPDLIEAQRALRVLQAEEYVRRLVDGFPPLTREQRARLATLLQPAEVKEADDAAAGAA